ncbi:MAG: TVP38/TMEM64 family protein [Stellaceae bacterium]
MRLRAVSWAGRLVGLGLIIIGIGAAWRWRALLDYVQIGAAIGRWPAAPLVFIAAHIAASLLFVPRMLLAVVAGVLFGLAWGTVWAALGSVTGAAAGFLVARYLNAGLIDFDRSTRLRPLLDRMNDGGWRAVAVLRLIPVVPHSLANYGLGLTRVRFGAYAVGSLLGQLPMTIAYVAVGAAGERVIRGCAGWVAPTSIAAAALGLSLLIPLVIRHRPDRPSA